MARKVPSPSPPSSSHISTSSSPPASSSSSSAPPQFNIHNDMRNSHPFLMAAVVAFFAFTFHFLYRQVTNEQYRSQLFNISFLSVAAFFATCRAIPIIRGYNLRAGLVGKDINKKGTPRGDVDVPESLGLVPAVIFLACIILSQMFYNHDPRQLVEYNAALLSICFMVFLGFADDVLELPWRYKLILPTVASLPLLVAYTGGTVIVVPKPLQLIFGTLLDLGILYKVYMGLLSVFCINSINIFAGINGLEAGQSLVIACAVLVHNIVELENPSEVVRDHHIFSLFLILPFIATTLGLLTFNWYPSSVFVGDTYTYFAGVTFAVVGILGHFSKTLMLFFMPQILNFLISLPQLLHIIPCPRHRLPIYDTVTHKLSARPGQLNNINIFLRIFGPMSEHATVICLLIFQVLCCCLGFFVRYELVKYFYDS